MVSAEFTQVMRLRSNAVFKIVSSVDLRMCAIKSQEMGET